MSLQAAVEGPDACTCLLNGRPRRPAAFGSHAPLNEYAITHVGKAVTGWASSGRNSWVEEVQTCQSEDASGEKGSDPHGSPSSWGWGNRCHCAFGNLDYDYQRLRHRPFTACSIEATCQHPQPAATDDLLTVKDLKRIMQVGGTTIYRWVKHEENFPRPIWLGRACARWRSSDVNRFIVERQKEHRSRSDLRHRRRCTEPPTVDATSLWTMKQTAKFLGVGERTVRDHVRFGDLLEIAVGRGLRRPRIMLDPQGEHRRCIRLC
jgi:predicted DNA-binding transcriptional regulator AlpA